jgi:Txe/YoeB family toxin of Txe-Axe toxin-antitoxin module
MSTVIQSTSAKEDSVKTLVTQMNDRVIPGIQDVLDTLSQDHYKLCERVAKLEGKEEGKAAVMSRRIHGDNAPSEPTYAAKPAPVVPTVDAKDNGNPFRKQELPKLDLSKPEEESAE